MSIDEPTRSRLFSFLRELKEVDEGGRRIAPDTLRAVIRERSGLVVVHGATAAEGDRRTPYPLATAGSASQIDDALVVDQRKPGSVSWRTEAVPSDLDTDRGYVAFLFSLAMGNGSGAPQPSGTFALELEGQEVARFALVKGRRRWHTASGLLAFFPERVQSIPFGPVFAVDDQLPLDSTYVDGHAVLVVERDLVATGRPNMIAIRALSEEPSRQWARVGLSAWYGVFQVESHLSALVYACEPAEVVEHGGYRLLLGDLHSHSGESTFLDGLAEAQGSEGPCGVGSRASLFRYARDVAGLDFYCLSEHDWQMDDHDWAHLRRLNDEFLSESFVTVHGFEWTSMAYGHRNVYFADQPGSLFYAQDPLNPYEWHTDRPSPRDLWSHLRAQAVPALTIPHHMSAAQFPLDLRDFNDPDFDRVAEIYSAWGDSLEHGQPVTRGATRIERLEFLRTIRDGYRIGFIGSSDSHDGHPGLANGDSRRPQLFHHLGSGRAGVYTTDASRSAIFAAMVDRRTFAATGDGISVWTTLDGKPMGTDQDRPPGAAKFEVSVRSDLPLSSLSVYRNGRLTERVDALGQHRLETEWIERVGSSDTSSIFVKAVRSDGESAWSSPHWVVR